MTEQRISREDLYFEIAQSLRKRSTCLRGKVGCVAVLEDRIIATGYNGSPPNMPHCFELGCDVDANNHEAGCQRTIHAEANIIAFAAKHGVALAGAALYCTHGPCLKCAQLIVAAGIAKVYYLTPYRLPQGLELLDAAHVPAYHCGPREECKRCLGTGKIYPEPLEQERVCPQCQGDGTVAPELNPDGPWVGMAL